MNTYEGEIFKFTENLDAFQDELNSDSEISAPNRKIDRFLDYDSDSKVAALNQKMDQFLNYESDLGC